MVTEERRRELAAALYALDWQTDLYSAPRNVTTEQYERRADRLAESGVLDHQGPPPALPLPEGGCVCTPESQYAGGGVWEHLLGYEPACPEHSEHLWDPRLGEWVLREDPELVEGPCERTTAHGPHALPDDDWLDRCPGIPVHPNTMAGRRG